MIRSGRPPSAAEPVENGTLAASSSSHTSTIVIAVAVALAALVGIWFAWRWWKKSRADKSENATAYTKMVTTGTGSSAGAASEGYESEGRLMEQLRPLANWQIDFSELRDVSLIGSGAQGTVFHVKFRNMKSLASKRIVRDQFSEKKLTALVTEVNLVAKLHHSSIVAFVGVAWSSPYDFQVLYEYMPNGDLRSHLDLTRATVWDADKIKVALSIAEGLAYVHSFSPPIVHRDLKARNILLDAKMRAKISDFGVSRLQSENGTMSTGVGTSRWLAPKVITGGGAYTEQCDIYSFGVVLVEIDTHAVPFAELEGAMSDFKLLQQVASGAVRPQVSASCDPQIAELVGRCLSKLPVDRPNALEVAFLVRQIVRSH